MATILKSAYAFYNRQYQARPILTICTTNAILAGISDTLTQKYLAPSVSTSVSTSKSTSTSTSTSHSDHTDDSSSLIKEILQNAQDRSKEAMHKLAQDVEISWHEPKDKDGHSQGKIKADAEQAVGQAFIKVGQEMIEKSKQAENHDIIPDSTVVSIQATNSMDYPRMGRFMLYNFSVAPLIHTWYTILDKNFPIVTDSTKINSAKTSMLTRSMVPALKRVTADQVAFAPIGLALLFSGLTVLEGGGIQDIKNKLSNAYLPTLQANYMVWPLVQLVNFSVMPLQLRLPFVSVIGIAWNAYLSLANSKGTKSGNQQQDVVDSDTEEQSLAIAA